MKRLLAQFFAYAFSFVFLLGCADETNKRLDKMNEKLEVLAEEASKIGESFKSTSESADEFLKKATSLLNEAEVSQKAVESRASRSAAVPAHGDIGLLQFPTPKMTATVLAAKECGSASVDRAYDSLTNYKDYAQLSAGIMPVASLIKPLVGGSTYIQMLKSEVVSSETTAVSHLAEIDFELKPIRISDELLNPRFRLSCATTWVSDDGFIQICRLVKSPNRFALEYYRSVLLAKKDNGAICKTPGLLIQYQVEIQENAEDFAKIRIQALFGSKRIENLLGGMFTPEFFFKTYYSEFYKKWIESVSQ